MQMNISELEVQWFQSCADSRIAFVNSNLKSFVGKREQRETDFSDRIIKGFTGLQYAVFYNAIGVVKILLDKEIHLMVENTFNIVAEGINTGVKCQLSAGSNILMIAMLRGSRECISYIHEQITLHENMRPYVVGQSNANHMTNLCSAVLTSAIPECWKVFTDDMFIGAELAIAPLDRRNIFNYACSMGQLKCIIFLGDFMDRNSRFMKKELVTLLLQTVHPQNVHPYIQDAIEPMSNPSRYYSSLFYKEKCKISIIEMIQRALDICQLSDDPDLQNLLDQWQTLHYEFSDSRGAKRLLEVRLQDYLMLQTKVIQTITEGSDVFKKQFCHDTEMDIQRLAKFHATELVKQEFRVAKRLSKQLKALIAEDLQRWFGVDRQFVVRNLKKYAREVDESKCSVLYQVIAKDDLELFKQVARYERYMKVGSSCTFCGVELTAGQDLLQACILLDAKKIVKYLFESGNINKMLELGGIGNDTILQTSLVCHTDASHYVLEQPQVIQQFSKNLSFNPLMEAAKNANLWAVKHLKQNLLKQGMQDIFYRLVFFNKDDQRIDNVTTNREAKTFFESLVTEALEYQFQNNWFYKPEHKPVVMNFCNIFEMESMLKKYTDRDANILIKKDNSFKDENDQSLIIPKYQEQTSLQWLIEPHFQVPSNSKIPFRIVHPDILTTFSIALHQFDNQVQEQEISQWFDMACKGNLNYIKSHAHYVGKFDKRATRGMIINGFSALMYAIVNKQMDVINYLLDEEGKLYNNKETIFQFKSTMWFQSMSPAELLVVLNDSYMMNHCWSKVTDIEANLFVHLLIYTRSDDSIDQDIIMKKFIQIGDDILSGNTCYTIFHYLCEKSDLPRFRILLKILESLTDVRVKYSFYVQLLECFTDKSIYDCIKDDQLIRLIYRFVQSGLALLTLSSNSRHVQCAKTAAANMKVNIKIPDTILISPRECLKLFYRLPQKAVSMSPKRLEFDFMPQIIYLENLQVGTPIKLSDRDKYLNIPDTRITNIQSQTFYSFSALMYAIIGGNLQNVQSLIGELKMVTKVDIAIRNKSKNGYIYLAKGVSALHVALAIENQEAFDYLIGKMEEKDIISGPQSLSLLSVITDTNIPLNIMELELLQKPLILNDLLLNDFHQKILRTFLLEPFSQDTLILLAPVFFGTNLPRINKKCPNKQLIKDQLEPLFNRIIATQGYTEKLGEQINEFYQAPDFVEQLSNNWLSLVKTNSPEYVSYNLDETQIIPIQRGTASMFYPFVPEYDKFFKAIQQDQPNEMLRIVKDKNFMQKYLDRNAYDETFGYPINLSSIQQSVIYGANNCFIELAKLIGINHVTRINTVFDMQEKIRYLPKDSNLLHLAVLSKNESVIQYCVNSNIFRQLLMHYNVLGDIPLEIAVQINYLNKDLFLKSFLRLEFEDAIIMLAKVVRKQNPLVPGFLRSISSENPNFYKLYLQLLIVLKFHGAFDESDYIVYYYNECQKSLKFAAENQKDPIIKQAFQKIYGDDIDPNMLNLSNELSYTKMESSDQFNYQYICMGDPLIDVDDQLLSDWFTACYLNDVTFIKQNMRLIGQRDKRDSDLQNCIVKNFTGLMYAIYNDSIEVVRVLVKFEVNKLLLDQQKIYSKLFEGIFFLPGQSSALILALIRNSTQTIDYLHSLVLSDKFYFRVIISNQHGLTNLSVAAMTAIQEASFNIVSDESIIEAELDVVTDSDTNFLITATSRMQSNVILKVIDMLRTAKQELKMKLVRYVLRRQVSFDDIPLITEFEAACQLGYNSDLEIQKTCRLALLQLMQLALDIAVLNSDSCVNDWKDIHYQFIDGNNANRTLEVQSKEVLLKRQIQKGKVIQDSFIQFALSKQQDIYQKQLDDIQLLQYDGIQNLKEVEDWLLIHESSWFDACAKGDLNFVKLNFNIFIGKRDRRQTNFKNHQIQNFTGLQYAAFYDNIDILKILLPLEIYVDVNLILNITADGISTGLKCQIAPQTSILMLSMLRGSVACVKYIHQLVKVDPNIRKSVIGKMNTNKMSNLAAAVLTSQIPECFGVFCDNDFLEREIELGEGVNNIINYCCEMGQIRCLLKMHNMVIQGNDQQKLRLVRLLLNTEFGQLDDNPYVVSCSKELESPEKYGTSKDNQRLCKLILFDMIQFSLDFSVQKNMVDLLQKWRHIHHEYHDVNGETVALEIRSKEEIELLQSPDEIYRNLVIRPYKNEIISSEQYQYSLLNDRSHLDSQKFEKPTTAYTKSYQLWVSAIKDKNMEEVVRLETYYRNLQNLDPADFYYSFTGLMYAILANNFEAVKFLKSEFPICIERKVYIGNVLMEPGDTALELCLILQRYDMFKYLMQMNPGFGYYQLQNSTNFFNLEIQLKIIYHEQYFWPQFLLKVDEVLTKLVETQSYFIYLILYSVFLSDFDRKQVILKIQERNIFLLPEEMQELYIERCAELGVQDEFFLRKIKVGQARDRSLKYQSAIFVIKTKIDPFLVQFEYDENDYQIVRTQGLLLPELFMLYDGISTVQVINIHQFFMPDLRSYDAYNHIYTGFFPIHYAIFFDNRKLLLSLLPYSMNLCTKDEVVCNGQYIAFGSNPLLLALQLRQYHSVQILVQQCGFQPFMNSNRAGLDVITMIGMDPNLMKQFCDELWISDLINITLRQRAPINIVKCIVQSANAQLLYQVQKRLSDGPLLKIFYQLVILANPETLLNQWQTIYSQVDHWPIIIQWLMTHYTDALCYAISNNMWIDYLKQQFGNNYQKLVYTCKVSPPKVINNKLVLRQTAPTGRDLTASVVLFRSIPGKPSYINTGNFAVWQRLNEIISSFSEIF